VERRKAKKPLSRMSNKEIRSVLRQRYLMMSWVAYLDEEGERVQTEYIKESLLGIESVEKEIAKREMEVSVN